MLLALSTAPAVASVYKEIYTFDATLTYKQFNCGINPLDLEPCDDSDPTYGVDERFLAYSMNVGEVFEGIVEFSFEAEERPLPDSFVSVSCVLGGRNCLFGTGSVDEITGPMGPTPSVFELNDLIPASEVSHFNFEEGSYSYGTDYMDFVYDELVIDDVVFYDAAGFFTYAANFSLSDITYELVPPTLAPATIPLPGGLPLMLGATFVFGLGRRILKRKQ